MVFDRRGGFSSVLLRGADDNGILIQACHLTITSEKSNGVATECHPYKLDHRMMATPKRAYLIIEPAQ